MPLQDVKATAAVCLFVFADGKERQIKAAALAKQVSRSRDLAARPRTVLLFLFSQPSTVIRTPSEIQTPSSEVFGIRMAFFYLASSNKLQLFFIAIR